MIPEKGHRRLRIGRWSAPGATYFLTICAGPLPESTGELHGLCQPEVFQALLRISHGMELEQAWRLRCLTLMPDHLHAVMELGRAVALSEAVRLFKGRSSILLRKVGLAWQKGGVYDHRMRADEPRLPVYHYIFMNPYRKGLVNAGQTWPYFWCADEDRAWFIPCTDGGMPYPEWLKGASGA